MMQNHIAVQDLRQESKTHLDLDVIERQGLSWTHTLDWYRTKKIRGLRLSRMPAVRIGREGREGQMRDRIWLVGREWIG